MTSLLLLASLLSLANPATPDRTSVRRFALVASSNDGGAGRARLRFADSDARAMAGVLQHLGGVRRDDVVVIERADRARLQEGFARMRGVLGAARTPNVRQELFVYYSGHSDEEGLLVGGDRVGYRELRRWIDDAGADVRIGVLDSCASGALIRLKGGTHVPSFLNDASIKASGHAFLTASSADEAAQESDRIGAAFFTHYLLSGLRGAADTSRDGRVTLNEAYQFAYHETLRRTETSRAGAQHPAYDIQLAGTGDLVLTDLRATNARLVVAENIAGRLYVRDAAGRLLVEMRKEPLYPVELGLEAGRYRVVLDADGRLYEAQVDLAGEGRFDLGLATFAPVTPIVTASRGGRAAPETAVAATAAGPPRYRFVPLDLVLAPGIRLSGSSDLPVMHSFVLGVVAESDALRGLQLSLAGNIVRQEMHGAQIANGFNLAQGRARGVQIASLANVASAGFEGAQTSAVVNIVRGELRGAQIGTVNLALGPVRGAQVGVVNAVSDGQRGGQVGVINLSRAGLSGAQVGVVNVGSSVAGAQFGVVNVGGDITGAQFGVINFARRNSGLSFGLLPLVLDGYNHLQVWSSDVTRANLGVKLGTRHFYTLWGAGVTDGDRTTDETLFAAHLGFGGHASWLSGRLFLDVDVVATALGTEHELGRRNGQLGTARAVLGFQVARHLAITAGPTFNVQTSWDGEDFQPGSGVFERVIRSDDGEATVRMFPGFLLGIQI